MRQTNNTSHSLKPIKDVLKSAYEKRLKLYNEIEQIDAVLKKHAHTLSSLGQQLLSSRTNISYKNNTLTIFIPAKLFSPETHFVTSELKGLFERSKNQNIRVVRFQTAPS